jgi:hypothetical protein
MADFATFALQNFKDRWELTTRQMHSALRDKVTIEDFKGKSNVYTDIGEVTWNEQTGRLEDSNPQEITAFRRKLMKRNFDCQVIFDRTDEEYVVQQLTTPGSVVEQAMKAAWAEKFDNMLATSVTATVYGGAAPNYSTAIDIDSTAEVASTYVHTGSPAASGLTPWKLIELVRKFNVRKVNVGGDGQTITGLNSKPVWLAIGSKQKSELWTYVSGAGNEVWANAFMAFLNGQTNKLFGFNVVMTEELPLNSSTDVRSCVAWTPTGMIIVPDKYEFKVDVLPTKKHAIQLTAYAQYGAMRRREEEVGVIYADESP